MTHLCVWHDMCEMTNTSDTTHPYVWDDTSMCVKWHLPGTSRCVTWHLSVLHWVALCCTMLQCVAVCCSVLQCVKWHINLCDMTHSNIFTAPNWRCLKHGSSSRDKSAQYLHVLPPVYTLDMTHIHIHHGPYMNESWPNTCTPWIWHIHRRHGTHVRMSRDMCTPWIWHTYTHIMAHVWMSHDPNTYTCYHPCTFWIWQVVRMWIGHGTHMDESRNTYEWVVTHIWMSHDTHINEN